MSGEESIFAQVARAGQGLTYAEARQQVPMLFVLEQFDVHYQHQTDAYFFLCPVHEESRPSANIFGTELAAWNCFSCGAHGDVTELICAFKGCKPPAALRWLQDHLTEARAWTGPRVGVERPTVNLEEVTADVVEATNGPFDLTRELIEDRGWKFDAEWLREEFGVGESEGRIVIPFFDAAGALVTYKTRTPSTKPYSLSGSDFKDILYLINKGTGLKPVILTGSESDSWVAYWYHGTDFDIASAPTGEAARPRQAHLLAGRTVYTAFDGDVAGDLGTAKWTEALHREGCTVFNLRIPRGSDVASHGDLSSLIEDATEATSSIPEGFQVGATGLYVDKEEITNWIFEPHYVAESDQGQVFKGVILPDDRPATIQSSDLLGRGSLARWANRNRKAYFGKDKHAQMILGALQAMRSRLVKAKAVSIVGLHENSFVWPGGTIGSSGLVFTPPFQQVSYRFKIEEGRWSAKQLNDMLGMMDRTITTPILAWYAMSMLRSKYSAFPLLGVFGSAGAGKTTILNIMPHLTGARNHLTLTATTEQALYANYGGINAWGVHIDELREENRPDTFARQLQMIRDLYDALEGQKANQQNWASTGATAMVAPVVLSGETTLTEISHKERIIMVPLNKHSAIIGGLDPIYEWEDLYDEGGLAFAFLTFLTELLQSGRFEPARTPLVGSIPPRIQHNLGVLRQGWWVLREFAGSNGVDIGELDLSLVMDRVLNGTGNPLHEALAWCSTKPAAESGVRYEMATSTMHVDIPTFVRAARGAGFALVGNMEAVRELLVNEFDAQSDRSKYSLQFVWSK